MARARSRGALWLACAWLAFGAGCRLKYELLASSSPPAAGATSAGSGAAGGGGTPGTEPTGGGGTPGTEPTGGAGAVPSTGGTTVMGEAGAGGVGCIEDCEPTGLGPGSVLTFGHTDSDFNTVVADTVIDAGAPNEVLENYGFLVVTSMPNPISSLLRFELSDMPPGVTVTGASLALDVWHTSSTVGSVTVHEVLESRIEFETTWNERATGIPWTSGPGCGVGSRSQVVLARFEPYTNGVLDIALPASVIQRWLDDPSTNFGFILVGDGSDFVDFRPAGVGTGVKPQLSISYQ